MDAAETEAERIDSEDEGPQDFTLNLEKWMTGNENWRKQMEDAPEGQKGGENEEEDAGNESESYTGEHEQETDNASVQAEDAVQERVVDESEFEPLSTSTPAPLVNQKHPGQEKGFSTDNGNYYPPRLTRLNTELQQNRAAEEVFEQISALQAEVERLRLGDENNRYINEMLKRAHVSDQAENGRLKDELQNVKEEGVRLEREVEVAEKALATERKVGEDAKSEVGSVRASLESMEEELAVAKSTTRAEKQTARIKILALETNLQATREEISDNRKHFTAVLDARAVEMDHLRSDFQACKREASTAQQAVEAKLVALQTAIVKERKDFKDSQDMDQAQIKRLRSELQFFKNELSGHQQESEARQADLMVEITELITKVEAAQDLESQLAVQKMDLDHVQEELQETRHTLETIEHENDGAAREVEEQRKEKAEMIILLDRKSAALRSAESAVERLRDEITRHEAEKHTGTTEAEAHESELEQLQQQHQKSMDRLIAAHEKELKSLKSTILRAGDGMRKREQRLENSHREELATLHARVDSLEASAAAASDLIDWDQASPERVAEMRAAIRTLSSKLAAAMSKATNPDHPSTETVIGMRAAIRSLSSQLSAASAALQATHLALDESVEHLSAARAQNARNALQSRQALDTARQAHDAARLAQDARFGAMFEAREKEWRKRIGLMFRERERMGNALLCAWGREEEVGPDGGKGNGKGEAKEGGEGRQVYRYRFVER